MDPEVKEVLEHIEEISEENNRMLKSLHNSARWAKVFLVIKWAFIIGVAIGAFYFLQPIFDKVDTIYNTVTNSHLPNIQDFIQKFNK